MKTSKRAGVCKSVREFEEKYLPGLVKHVESGRKTTEKSAGANLAERALSRIAQRLSS